MYIWRHHASKEEKEDVPNNGHGKASASYLRIVHDGQTHCLKSDAMEPEDCSFHRDLSWGSTLFT